MADAGALYLPDRLHGVRIAVKKLRYAVELSAEVSRERSSADLRMHDVQMLIDQVRQTQASLAPPSVTVWRELDTLVASLEDDCRRLHARYMRERDALSAVAERRVEQTHPSTSRVPARRAG